MASNITATNTLLVYVEGSVEADQDAGETILTSIRTIEGVWYNQLQIFSN